MFPGSAFSFCFISLCCSVAYVFHLHVFFVLCVGGGVGAHCLPEAPHQCLCLAAFRVHLFRAHFCLCSFAGTQSLLLSASRVQFFSAHLLCAHLLRHPSARFRYCVVCGDGAHQMRYPPVRKGLHICEGRKIVSDKEAKGSPIWSNLWMEEE